MTSKGRRYVQASAASLILFALVLWVALRQEVDLSEIDPRYLIPAVLAYSFVLTCRAAIFRLLSATQTRCRFSTWVSLAARHQLVFIIFPSGSGDLAFPALARKMVGLEVLPATRLIAEARLRDILAVLGLGCAGLVATGHMLGLALAGFLFCLAALFWSDVSVRVATTLLQRLRRARGQDKSPTAPLKNDVRMSFAWRICVMAVTLALWGGASGGILAAFHAAGYPLNLAESWVMLAGLNVAGALALSVAGFGVAEAGAAGVLVFLGVPLANAAAIAIVARFFLLISNCLACALMEFLARLARSRQSAT